MKLSLSDIESWTLARVRPNRKAGESEYYGHTGENLMAYTQEFLKWNPETSDPMSEDTDERAAVGIGPRSHGRHKILDSMITPSVSYRQIRAIDPRTSNRPCPRSSTSSSLSLLAQQNSAYMNFIRGQQFDWNERVATVTEHNRRTTELLVASMSRGEVPTLPPAPPSPGPQPVPPTFEQFLVEYYGTPGTDGSFVGGGPTNGSAHEPQSPIYHRILLQEKLGKT